MQPDLRTYRASKNLTQAELGRLLGVGQGLISNIESGRRSVSKTVATRLYQLDPTSFPLERLLGVEVRTPATSAGATQ